MNTASAYQPTALHRGYPTALSYPPPQAPSTYGLPHYATVPSPVVPPWSQPPAAVVSNAFPAAQP